MSQLPEDIYHMHSTQSDNHPKKGKRWVEVGVIISLALFSFMGGFALIYFLVPAPGKVLGDCEQLGGDSETQRDPLKKNDWVGDKSAASGEIPQNQATSGVANSAESAFYASGAYAAASATGPTPEEDSQAASAAEMPEQGAALPEVPPGPRPKNLVIDGAPHYLKCWNSDGVENKGKDCDRLRLFEKRFATRLYVIEKCREEVSQSTAVGKLSLGVQIDFQTNGVKFWSGPSSQLDDAKKIGMCIRNKLAGLPLYGIEHRLSRYRLFYTIDFFDPVKRAKEIAQLRRRGKTVAVIKDRVNVREAPKTGASIGRISSDSSVTLLKKHVEGDWCHVLTPSDREGWIICDALKLKKR